MAHTSPHPKHRPRLSGKLPKDYRDFEDRPAVFSDPKKQERFERELKRIQKINQPLHDEIAACERLTTADFTVRINVKG